VASLVGFLGWRAAEGLPVGGAAAADEEVPERRRGGPRHPVLLAQELPPARALHLPLVVVHQHLRLRALGPRHHRRRVDRRHPPRRPLREPSHHNQLACQLACLPIQETMDDARDTRGASLARTRAGRRRG
jgi:hypothetical protein